MKSIVNILMIVLISSILISAFPNADLKSRQTLSIQCENTDASMEKLNKSADIIKSRLIDFGMHDANVIINRITSCIEISLDSQEDIDNIACLVTSKGRVEFYETYDRFEVIYNLGIDKDLASILTIPTDSLKLDRYSGIYGYCKEDKKTEVDQFLKKHYVSKPGFGINFFWSEQPDDNGEYSLFLLKHHSSLDNSFISESVVKRDLPGKQPELLIQFNDLGKTIWQDITKRNIGKPIAIVLDKKVLQAPIVRTEISDGKCNVTGDFSLNEINRISSLINNEELPLDFHLKN